jgi:hypothetical protein
MVLTTPLACQAVSMPHIDLTSSNSAEQIEYLVMKADTRMF